MTPELWQRLKPHYNAVLDLPEKERADYVDGVCDREPDIAASLRDLLTAHDHSASLLDTPLPHARLLLQSRPAILAPDTVLAGRFRIVRHLGSGGMGDVYEALDLELEQGRIALKTIRPVIAGDPVALTRFKDEVRLARKVTGPNVCRIHELYLADRAEAHGVAFLTMELLEGVTLYDRIAQTGPLSLAEMRFVAEQLCAALCCIHEAGIVHGDLKPRNVMMVTQNGTEKAVVMDFGLACTAQTVPVESSARLAQANLVAGTPSYMAPEQFEGGELVPATDIYALGLILYELATGVQLFTARSPLAAAVQRAKQPQTASTLRYDLPSGWDEVIDRCLQYDPARRFQSASDVISSLQHPRNIVWHLGRDHRFTLSRKVLATAAIVVSAVLIAGLAVAVRSRQQRRLSPDVAHWNTLGMSALREGSYLKATRLLTIVTERDPRYPVAHAALADAWLELDFTEAAQREILLASAPAEQHGLSEEDRSFIDAVRNTLLRDYAAATQAYERMLLALPGDGKAKGYVDLGRAYEKAGRMREAMASYEQAARLDPDAPAPLLHLGILRSRLRQPVAAQQAFRSAETLYRAESDQEGLAEIAYQRGYAANEAGNFQDAKRYLNQSFTTARQIPSMQLQVRSLSQLSSVAYRESRDDVAITYANQEIQMADENGLEYWSTDGLVRLGNAFLDKGDFTSAEQVLEQAIRKAQPNNHPFLNASAKLTFASLRDRQKRWDEQISLARSALKYYQDYGFLDQADQAQTLILRGERDKGEFEEALQAGNQLLQIANRTQSTFSVAMAQELVGQTLMLLERYPEALSHFEQGTRDLRSLGQDPGYLQVHQAEALVPLGRLPEADIALDAISPEMRKRADIGAAIATVRARMSALKGDSKTALSIVEDTWRRYPETRSDRGEFDSVALLAEAQQGRLKEAREGASQLASAAYLQGKGLEAAHTELLQADLDLLAKDGSHAAGHAEAAEGFFAAKHILESQALSVLAEAEAAQMNGDSENARRWSQKSVDIFRQLEQSWGVPAFETYAARPDRRKTLHILADLSGENGVFLQ